MAKKTAAAAKTADFLLDVHTEPFPARFVPPALEQLKAGAAKWLAGKVEHGEVSAYGTLRHLVLTVKAVAPKGHDKTERFKGPKEQVWKTPDGAYSPAAEGFARKYGLCAADLIPEGGILYAEVSTKGGSAAALLEAMIPELLKGLQFPKSMTWEATDFKFGRPIRAIAALYGEKVVPVTIAGVKSSRAVYGHPTYAKAAVQLKDPAKHMKALRDQLVIADPVERREYLLKQLGVAAKSAGGQPDFDEELVDETVFMAEHPTPVVGRLRPEHMHLPAALLKMVMKKQLKFFPVVGKQGELQPAFIGVRDGLSTGNALVREGYQRVLEARFNDAAFFFGRDAAATLESRLPALKRVTYQKALGSMSDKSARVESLAHAFAISLSGKVNLDLNSIARASRLVYADLVTDVVKEFPELQGHMGGVYARQNGFENLIARCIEEFYFPIASKSPVPQTAEGAIISLAGKLDSIAGCFAAGLIPTGSADPYALRRQAAGVIRILIERNLPLNLREAIQLAVDRQPTNLAGSAHPEELTNQIADFIWARTISLFEEKQYKTDEIRSIRLGAFENLPQTELRLAAIRAVRGLPDFGQLAESFKRASNIIKQSKGIAQGVVPDPTLLKEEAEIELAKALDKVEIESKTCIERQDFNGALISLVAITPYLNRFFDGVMVMDPNPSLMLQRLAILAKLIHAFKRVADLSEIQVSAS